MSAVLSAVLKCFPSNMKKRFSDPSLNFNFENAENETPNQRVTVRTDEELNKGGEGEEKTGISTSRSTQFVCTSKG